MVTVINTEEDAHNFILSASLHSQWVFDGWPEDPSDIDGFDRANKLYDSIFNIINSKEFNNV